MIRRPDPNRVSIVSHKRLSDIIGGFYEEMTYQRQTMNDSGKLFSQKTTTTSRRGPAPSSRTVPAQSRDYRKRPMLEMHLAVIRKELKLPLPQLLLKLPLLDQARDHKMEEVLLPLLKTVTRSQSSGRRH